MRVHKPKVEYKLALQEKSQGSILTYYYKTNNLTRINWRENNRHVAVVVVVVVEGNNRNVAVVE